MSSFIKNDGGRAAAGFKGDTGDCVTRAIAITSGKPYIEVYNALNLIVQGMRKTRKLKFSSARTGIPRRVYQVYLDHLGAQWVPCMKIGSGCQVHLKRDELPLGRLIARCSRHLVAVIDGVVHDTYEPSRGGSRCVYGYWQFPVGKP